MQQNLVDKLVEGFMNSNEDVVITLHDGGTVTGTIKDFDGYVMLVSGNPDMVLYRHAVMKMLPASAASAEKTAMHKRPALARQQPRKERKQSKQTSRPRRDDKSQRPSAGWQASEDTGFSNPMAEAMQKWLKSQKGGG